MNHIGIDLGTTNSVACTVQDGQFVYLDFRRSDLLPSVLLYQGGKVTIGAAAKRKSETFPQNYISSAKTYMGSTDTLKEIEGRSFTPTDVATEVLAEIYRVAQKYFANDDPIEAVITTPAYFDSVQNFETERAGKAAGFIVKQILPEPVSAALAYAMDDCDPGEKIYVVDLGGGTFDVTLLEVVNRNEFNTLMKDGDNHLGGDNFDAAIMEIMYRAIRLSAGVNLADEKESGLTAEDYGKAQQKLKVAAERCKCELSASESTEVSIVSLFPHKGSHYDFSLTITRQDFLEEASLYVNKVKNTIKHSFDNLDYDQGVVDRVILVGGSARMPFVRDFVKSFFGKEPYADKDLAKLVAMGAALKANDENETIISRDIITRSLGIELVGKRFAVILPKNKVYPCDNSVAPDDERIFTTVYDYQDSVDINVYVGEDSNVDNNTFYDGFTLDGIERAPRGVPQIEVIFSFDKSQILHVTSRDLRTGASSGKEIAIDRNGGKKKIAEPKVPAYDIMVLLDNSGSMSDSMYIAKDACRRLLGEMLDLSLHRAGFITFETQVLLRCPLTQNRADLLAAVDTVSAGGSTDMTGAFIKAGQELSDSKKARLVIIVTDGMPDYQHSATSESKKLKDKGIKIAAIGVGNIDHAYLSTLASTPQDYYQLSDMGALAATFQTIVQGLQRR